MIYTEIENYILSKKGSVRIEKVEWDCILFKVFDKMFVMLGQDNKGLDIITVKCDIAFGEMLRKQYRSVFPGYYMNKQHWNSVYLTDCDVPFEVLCEMIDASYRRVVSSLKKTQKEQL
ncbi:MAG: MmcQ/YjbR family DNA-binding protein [Erysipelotrichaceae bacterium]|nr:MmcQ/YjbR family DNA-binding protein [Erysipelotrichaceae bacterium]MDP3305328.1 MmcQ/YjbR family DNA-binding protein [Erysipelotrichaceae bacterium]